MAPPRLKAEERFWWQQDEDALEQLQDPEFLRALAKIRKREALEPRAEEGSEEEEEEVERPRAKKRKKEKPVLLKDVARDMVI